MITIAIPTIGLCTREQFEQSFQSAVETDKRWVSEILLIDNAESREFNLYLQELVKQDSRIKYSHYPEKGQMDENWNKAFDHCSNKWILFLHDDDFIEPKAFPHLERHLDMTDLGFISFDFNVLEGGKTYRYRRRPGMLGVLKNTPKFVSTVINVEKLKEVGKWEGRAGHALDLLAFIKLQAKYDSLHISEVLGTYRVHAENASAKRHREKSYGNCLPFLISECFPLLETEELKRKFMFHVNSFSYPHKKFKTRAVNFILRKLGMPAWFVE